jgi:hypothetical protein
MLKCPSCSFDNDDFATVCVQCKGYLQNRVPNLDFFETAWGIIESPKATFRTITLAEHKNYVFLLFVFFGVAVSFTTFWYLELGNLFDSLLFLIPWALGGGVAGGLIISPVLSIFGHTVGRALGSNQKFRNSNALFAYSLVPIALSLFLVLPIELLTFGMYLFTSNPHPYVIKPVSYLLLVGFDVLMTLWTIVLAVTGMTVVYRFSVWKAAGAVLIILFAVLGLYYLAAAQVTTLLHQIA